MHLCIDYDMFLCIVLNGVQGVIWTMSNAEMEGSGKQSKSKGSSSQRSKGKEKESTNLDYDHTRFTDKVEEKLYN